MSVDVLINGIGWVEVPEAPPQWPMRTFDKWTERDHRILTVLLPRYSLKQIAGALDRSEEAVRRMVYTKGLAA